MEIARKVDRVYDFALPPLVLHTLFEKNARALKQWLAISPRNAVTVLDTHDGIGVIDVGADARDPQGRAGPAAAGRHRPARRDHSRAQRRRKPAGHRRRRQQPRSLPGELHFLRCPWPPRRRIPDRARHPVLRPGDSAGLLRRAFRRNQRYGAAGANRRRPRYQPALLHGRRSARQHLERPVVRRLLELIRFRNRHGAFAGEFRSGPLTG